MQIIDYFRLAVIIAAFGIQFFGAKNRPENLRKSLFRFIFYFSIAAVSAILLYWTIAQYFLWENTPFQKLTYFPRYIFMRFWFPYALSLALAVIFSSAAKYFNRKYGERFFEPEEFYLLATAMFLVGHPGWVVYVIFILAASVSLSAVYLLKKMEGERFPLYWLWLPTAFFTIIINKWLITTLPWLMALKIGNI